MNDGLGLISHAELVQRRSILDREVNRFHLNVLRWYSAQDDATKAELAHAMSTWGQWMGTWTAWFSRSHWWADAFAFTTQMEDQIVTWRNDFEFEARRLLAAGVRVEPPSLQLGTDENAGGSLAGLLKPLLITGGLVLGIWAAWRLNDAFRSSRPRPEPARLPAAGTAGVRGRRGRGTAGLRGPGGPKRLKSMDDSYPSRYFLEV